MFILFMLTFLTSITLFVYKVLHQIICAHKLNIFYMIVRVRVALLVLLHYVIKAEELRWELMHQSDYDVIPHRIEVKWSNKSYIVVHQLELVKYNRSAPRSMNVSVTLKKRIDKELLFRVQLYKFISNTYKYFPVAVMASFCKEFNRNSFHLRDTLTNYTNWKICPPPPGHYYAKYLSIDYSKCPPHIPRGDFKSDVKIFNGDEGILHLEKFYSIVDKPQQW